MTVLTINRESTAFSVISELEQYMEDKGISITGSHLRLNIVNKEFHIGRDSCEFPRTVEEDFWRYDE